MQLTEMQEKMLRGVLDQLMSSYTMSKDELSATHAYLFGHQPVAPFFTDKELFETILYLQETIAGYGLPDLESLVAYYENKKKEVHDFFTHAVEELDNLVEEKNEPIVGEHLIRISDSITIAQAEMDTLVLQISSETGRFFEELYTKTIQFFESPPLPASGETDIHSAVKKHVRELVMTNEPVSMEWLSVQTILPQSIKLYVEQFASHYNGEQLFFIQFGKRLADNIQMLASGYRDLFACHCKDAFNECFQGSLLPDYAAIMNIIKREEPITDNGFKIQLTEWLVYSKLIISHCQYDEPEQDRPAQLDLSVEHLFQTKSVRVYGGSNMHYWIHNLFAEKLSVKKWVILKRRPGHFWLTSDNPGFLININDLQGDFTEVVPRHSLLDIRPDSVLYYPLSKDYCLKLEPKVELREESGDDLPINYATPSDDEQDFVNGVTVSTFKKVVITNQRKTLQQIQL